MLWIGVLVSAKASVDNMEKVLERTGTESNFNIVLEGSSHTLCKMLVYWCLNMASEVTNSIKLW
jgi:hypothetical protein